MTLLYSLLGVLITVGVLIFATSFICFYMVFYSKKRTLPKDGEYEIPPGRVYESFRPKIVAWVDMARSLPYECFEITSDDGLTLRGKYYEYQKGAPTELLFHGYRGYAERDLSGGIARCHALGRNALLIDQRASGTSDGSVISFGINERRDCRLWVDWAAKHFGEEVPLYITGVSMGAATVLLTASEPLPKNVVGALADCPYSSQKEIICRVIRKMGLPDKLLYPFVKLGARIYGGFDLEEISPIEAVKHLTIPVVFIHGDGDTFVPSEMSEALYEAAVAPQKDLYIIKDAEHGLAFPTDEDGYIEALCEAQGATRAAN